MLSPSSSSAGESSITAVGVPGRLKGIASSVPVRPATKRELTSVTERAPSTATAGPATPPVTRASSDVLGCRFLCAGAASVEQQHLAQTPCCRAAVHAVLLNSWIMER